MAHAEQIKDYSGTIIAIVEHKDNGDEVIRNFSGKILGTYDARANYARDFSGKILSQGNTLTQLIK